MFDFKYDKQTTSFLIPQTQEDIQSLEEDEQHYCHNCGKTFETGDKVHPPFTEEMGDKTYCSDCLKQKEIAEQL